MIKAKDYTQTAIEYADKVVSGEIIVGDDIVNACRRFQEDMKRDDLELRPKEPNAICSIMEGLFVHAKGEDMEGRPLMGKPLILQPWEIFCVVNCHGFYYAGTDERRFKEAFIEVARKNGKTSFIAAWAFAVGIIQRQSGSTIYIVANALKQALEAFNFIKFTIDYRKLSKEFRILNNSFNHSIEYTFRDGDKIEGTLHIEALASNPDSQDSFNCNFAIADEVAAYKKPAQYNRFKEAMKAYRNKLMVGITTAGDNANSFGYRRIEYAAKVASGVVKDDSFFAFIARADQDDKGNVDYTNPVQHQKANLSYGVTVSPEELMQEARQAESDPQQRKDFLSRSLNIYTTALRTYFDVEEFKRSDRQYAWTIDELAKLPIDWYGGADLSKMHDLTAAALYGQYGDVDIAITHGFIPVTTAIRKQEEDSIPVYQWADEGQLTMCNTPTVNYSDIVNWFLDMRKKGFKIKIVGQDRKFAEEFFLTMKRKRFKIIDQPQYFHVKSNGFRHIEKAAKDGHLYYLHSSAYEYCVSNIHGIEKVDDMIQYQKVSEESRIDLFDASVFACVQMLKDMRRKSKAESWWGDDEQEQEN